MPVATVDSDVWDRHELKSLEGAYIFVRPLPYGKILERRDKATKMYMESGDANTNSRMEVEMLQKWSTQYDFQYCLGDHNLTDKNDVKLDLGNRMVFESLDPRVGTEIEKILDKLNNIDDDFDAEGFTKSLSSSSSDQSESDESGQD